MPSAREKLFGAETKCDAGEKCLFGGKIEQGQDVIIVWIHRGTFPFALADIVSLEGSFEMWHADCALQEGVIPREVEGEGEIHVDEQTRPSNPPVQSRETIKSGEES